MKKVEKSSKILLSISNFEIAYTGYSATKKRALGDNTKAMLELLFVHGKRIKEISEQFHCKQQSISRLGVDFSRYYRGSFGPAPKGWQSKFVSLPADGWLEFEALYKKYLVKQE
ncbi:hypothetical protein M2404_003858 [Rheinheimera pacifica]|uniref:hypothetical protein n=1 Tax=Rheinheimera pacifica TaxID=173990 RepID=UPI00216722F5|nr:hypothetical protein [Rheinheimera pacifica]MCS4309486.1 hypothetical protein [Rheinheimera pacifica]